VDEELLCVGREGVERHRAAGGETYHDGDLSRKSEQLAHRCTFYLAARPRRLERGRFIESAPQPERRDRERSPDGKWNSPPPRLECRRGEPALEHDEHGERDELAGDERDVLKARVESAPLLSGHLAQG